MELFILKLLDCAISTLKSIFLYKNKNFLSSLFSAIASYFYLTMLVKLGKSNDLYSIILICVATFVGSLIPQLIMDKFEKDRVYVFEVFPNDNIKAKQFCDKIRELNLPISTYKGFNDDIEQVLYAKIFSQSREESKMIEGLIPSGFKYHIQEVKMINGI